MWLEAAAHALSQPGSTSSFYFSIYLWTPQGLGEAAGELGLEHCQEETGGRGCREYQTTSVLHGGSALDERCRWNVWLSTNSTQVRRRDWDGIRKVLLRSINPVCMMWNVIVCLLSLPCVPSSICKGVAHAGVGAQDYWSRGVANG